MMIVQKDKLIGKMAAGLPENQGKKREKREEIS
jgi:hypothetical protein